MSDLKPCPFCGSADIYWSGCGNFTVHAGSNVYQRLVCRRCGSGTTPFPPTDSDKCKELWNTRAVDAIPGKEGG